MSNYGEDKVNDICKAIKKLNAENNTKEEIYKEGLKTLMTNDQIKMDLDKFLKLVK